MPGTGRIMRCTPDDVFSTLADGWVYPTWVVGASRMRDVSPEWPEPGSEIHHSLGVWPVLINDTSEMVEWSPPERMRLRVKAGPVGGRAVVVLDVSEHEQGCVVRMGEEPVSGIARALPRLLWSPVLRLRNRETLRRLAFIAEGRKRERLAGEQTARPETPDTGGGNPGPQAREDAAEVAEDTAAHVAEAEVEVEKHDPPTEAAAEADAE